MVSYFFYTIARACYSFLFLLVCSFSFSPCECLAINRTHWLRFLHICNLWLLYFRIDTAQQHSEERAIADSRRKKTTANWIKNTIAIPVSEIQFSYILHQLKYRALYFSKQIVKYSRKKVCNGFSPYKT